MYDDNINKRDYSFYDILYSINELFMKHNSIDLQKVVFNNCSYVRFQRKGGINNNLRIISSLDLLSDTGITTVSISFKEGSLISSANVALTQDQDDVINFLIDTVPPKATISSSVISSNEYWVSPALNITIQIDEGIRESSLSTESFIIENGSIDNINRTLGRFDTYTAVVRPNDIYSDSQITIQLKPETIMDFAGNLNNIASNKFIWNYDGTSPKVLSITSTDISNGQYYK